MFDLEATFLQGQGFVLSDGRIIYDGDSLYIERYCTGLHFEDASDIELIGKYCVALAAYLEGQDDE